MDYRECGELGRKMDGWPVSAVSWEGGWIAVSAVSWEGRWIANECGELGRKMDCQ
ncbi:hypothetical protein [Chitinophaga sp. LS1]|uniref:hypothetical protein n=1 Tax=Chitinophaga sp. LS1 TaxID=3051176 RepID=UPI002AAB7C8D|nr:hypothetical protein [Chitinophaga sp. LS1]WPV70358.1 hypothetical protein QQL36_16750 [Chitinophaga sp. LS1]